MVALPLPRPLFVAQAKPGAKDYIAVVRSARDAAAARAFVALVLSPAGQAKLRAAGFGPP